MKSLNSGMHAQVTMMLQRNRHKEWGKEVSVVETIERLHSHDHKCGMREEQAGSLTQ